MLQADRSGLALSNTESMRGKTIVESYGVVSGNTVRAKRSSGFEPRLERF